MDIVVIIVAIIATICLGWAMWLLSERKRLSTKSENLSTKLVTEEEKNKGLQVDLDSANDKVGDLEEKSKGLQIDLDSANDKVGDLEEKNKGLQIDLDSANDKVKVLETELETSEDEKAKVSESNANALWQLYLSDVSLQAGAAAFYEERAKSELLESTNTVLQQKHDALNKTHHNFVDKSKKKGRKRLVLAVLKLGIDAVPYGGTAVDALSEVVDKVKDFFGEAGDAASDMGDALGDAKSLGEILEDLEKRGPISILMSQDTDEVPTALKEDVQSAYKGAFEQHLMEPEELDPSTFSRFATETLVQTGNVVTLQSVSGDGNEEAMLKIFSKYKDLGVEYYDYHKTYKSSTEGAVGSDSEG